MKRSYKNNQYCEASLRVSALEKELATLNPNRPGWKWLRMALVGALHTVGTILDECICEFTDAQTCCAVCTVEAHEVCSEVTEFIDFFTRAKERPRVEPHPVVVDAWKTAIKQESSYRIYRRYDWDNARLYAKFGSPLCCTWKREHADKLKNLMDFIRNGDSECTSCGYAHENGTSNPAICNSNGRR